MKRFLSQYSLNFPTTIIYMLQASEYDTKEYIDWLTRVQDFGKISKRGRLRWTNKTKYLALLLYSFITLYSIGIISIWLYAGLVLYINIALTVALLFIYPYALIYGSLIPLFLGRKIIQEPKERGIINRAKMKLNAHSAIKIAIVGSYGKTTAKEIILEILSGSKKVAATPGNFNTPIGISRFIEGLEGDEEVLIFELGEYYPGDIDKLCKLVEPDWGIITGINESHMKRFGTIENTISTILEIEDYVKSQNIFANFDDLNVKKSLKSNNRIISYNINGCSGNRAQNIVVSLEGTNFELCREGNTILLHSGLLGEHLVGILSCAITLASKIGVDEHSIINGVAKTVPFEHRMQPKTIAGATVIDDTYNGNIDGIRAGLKLLSNLEAKRKIYVTPGLVEQGSASNKIHAMIGELIAKAKPDEVYLMQNSVSAIIKKSLLKSGYSGKIVVVADPVGFYTNLEVMLARGDLVLMQNDWSDIYG